MLVVMEEGASESQIQAVIDNVSQRSADPILRGSAANVHSVGAIYQLTCTYYDALKRNDDAYIAARAIQCFVPGIPQIYYVGLLAGGNDMDLLRRTTVGRDINRHYYANGEVARDMERPVVQALCALLRFRNTHPAFAGTFHFSSPASDRLVLEWQHGADRARLDVDLGRIRASIVCTGAGVSGGTPVWAT